jgi:hypothetical protein
VGTWTWLAELALGQWTQRLWIVQEQLLNSEVVMLRGPSLLPWNAVTIIPALFYLDFLPYQHLERYWAGRAVADSVRVWDIVHAIFHLWCLRTIAAVGTSGAPKLSLRQNLSRYTYLQCEDPRDRVLALLSVSADSDSLGIVPDYSQPVSEFFHHVSVAILRRSRDLYFLSLVSRLDNLSEPCCASWALNVPRPAYLRSSGVSWNRSAAHPYSKLHGPLRFESGDSVLVLQGWVLDSIVLSTAPLYEAIDSSTRSEADFWRRLLDAWSALSLDQGVTVQLAASFYHCLGLGQFLASSNGDTHLGNLHHAYILWCLLRWCAWYSFKKAASLDFDVDARMAQWDRTITPLTALLVEPGAEHPRVGDELNSQDYERAFKLAENTHTRCRTFCVTEQRRICSGQNEVKEGDIIAAIQGAGALFVLRPVGSRHQLIGDAYVDGLMHGEAYEGLNPDEVDYDIELI